jgi:NOL1/NOP2/fmu family ribosome biogenesis protein
MQRFIFKTEKKEILKQLEYYGIDKLDYLLISTGKEKIRGYSGILSTDEIIELDKQIRIEIIGLYLLHNYKDELRLSIDAITLLKNKITKNILRVNESQAKELFKGQDIPLTKEDKENLKNETKGFKVLEFKGDLIGTAKLTEDRIINYLPKERRRKK